MSRRRPQRVVRFEDFLKDPTAAAKRAKLEGPVTVVDDKGEVEFVLSVHKVPPLHDD